MCVSYLSYEIDSLDYPPMGDNDEEHSPVAIEIRLNDSVVSSEANRSSLLWRPRLIASTVAHFGGVLAGLAAE